ncbi:hypothetical protein D9601_16290 [Sphingomonas sp. MA1305]|nr:hypothetical protein [Sphingomonas sp. MA1305]
MKMRRGPRDAWARAVTVIGGSACGGVDAAGAEDAAGGAVCAAAIAPGMAVVTSRARQAMRRMMGFPEPM